MNETLRFADIEKEFLDRAGRIVWCTVSTADAKVRPFVRGVLKRDGCHTKAAR